LTVAEGIGEEEIGGQGLDPDRDAGTRTAQVQELAGDGRHQGRMELQGVAGYTAPAVGEPVPACIDHLDPDLIRLVAEVVALPGPQPELIPSVGVQQSEQALRFASIGR
jgi:hypothetical protein